MDFFLQLFSRYPHDDAKDGKIPLSTQRLLEANNNEANDSLELEAIKEHVNALEGKFDLHSADLQGKVAAVESKVDAIESSMKEVMKEMKAMMTMMTEALSDKVSE